MTHLSYWMLPPGELTSPVLTPKVTAHNDLTLTVVREEMCQRFSVMPELKYLASFSRFLSTDNVNMQYYILWKRTWRSSVARSRGIKLSIISHFLSSLSSTQSCCHSLPLYISVRVCLDLHMHEWSSMLKFGGKRGMAHTTPAHMHEHIYTGLRPES